MMMSYKDAIEFINPAYNPNVASFFPQPRLISSSTPSIADSSVTSSNGGSLAVAPEGFNGSNTKQPGKVEAMKKKSIEALRCEICSIDCNSKKMLEKHILGKKHIKKTGGKNPDTLMLDHVKTDACMEGAEIRSVENIDIDASLPGAGLEEMCTTSGVTHGTQATLEPSSSSVANDTSSSKELVDEIMADERQSTPSNPASRTCALVCKVCNIFSNSQLELEKHLAGKTHARKIKYLRTVMSSPASVYPAESSTLKLASDTADPSSFVPVGRIEIKETIRSEGGTGISSKNICTVCKIECNSQEIFESHLSGRKHASKVRMLGSSIQPPYHSTNDQDATDRASKRGAYCDVCKIYCNSSEILDAHIMGRKHLKQLEKLRK